MPTYWLFWRKNRLNYFRAFYNSFFARLVTKKWLKVKKWPKKVTKSEEKKWRNFDKKMTKISVPVLLAQIQDGRLKWSAKWARFLIWMI